MHRPTIPARDHHREPKRGSLFHEHAGQCFSQNHKREAGQFNRAHGHRAIHPHMVPVPMPEVQIADHPKDRQTVNFPGNVPADSLAPRCQSRPGQTRHGGNTPASRSAGPSPDTPRLSSRERHQPSTHRPRRTPLPRALDPGPGTTFFDYRPRTTDYRLHAPPSVPLCLRPSVPSLVSYSHE